MIQAGKKITCKNDPLVKIKPEYFYHKLVNPNAEISNLLGQLRVVRMMDSKQYSLLKRNLPYVVCGIFNPPFRHIDNFAYIEHFFIDIDKVTEKNMNIEGLRAKIEADSRVKLCFVSPGEDGLKVMFKLKDRCYDAGIYSLFYKLFAKDFSAQYNLNQVLDFSTNDVTRACFVSVDLNAYYNPNSTCIDINKYLNTENVSDLFDIQKTLEVKETKSDQLEDKTKVKYNADVGALDKIKALLNPALKIKIEKKEAYVPIELDEIVDKLIPYLSEADINVLDVINIHYGKKIKLKLNFIEAEINLFFGKRGYSVVQSPRKGTNEEFSNVCRELINQFLLQ